MERMNLQYEQDLSDLIVHADGSKLRLLFKE
jgi:hypothetical protein